MINGLHLLIVVSVLCSIIYTCWTINKHKDRIATDKEELWTRIVDVIVVTLGIVSLFLPKSFGLWLLAFGVQGFISTYKERHELSGAYYIKGFGAWIGIIFSGIAFSIEFFAGGTMNWLFE